LAQRNNQRFGSVMNDSSPKTRSEAVSIESDEQLACRAQDGCTTSFTELVARLQPRLLFVLRRRLRNEADAEDVTQKTLLRAYEKLDLYDPSYKFSPWLFTIAFRLAADHHRKSRLPTVAGESASALVDTTPGPAQRAIDREGASDIWALAEKVLKPQQWTALWLQYGEGQTVKEIAVALGRTSVSVRVLLFRARQKLMPHLAQYAEEGDLGAIEAEAVPAQVAPTPQLVRTAT